MRPPRITDPRFAHLVTCRTVDSQFLLVPDEELNDIVGGVIARYQQRHQITIYGLTVLSNHYHIVCHAPHQNLWRFAKDVNKEVASRVNRYRSRKGFFWGRRYDDALVIEEQDALEALLYTVTNPTKHGLVRHCKSWPGVSSYFALTTGRESTYRFTHWTAYSAAKRRAARTGAAVFKRDYQTEHTLRLSPLPHFKVKTLKEQAKLLSPLIDERLETLVEKRLADGKGFLGRKNILQQSWLDFPQETSKSDRPLCYTKSREARKDFADFYYPWLAHYKEASLAFRSGDYDVEFPPHCLKPPLHVTPYKPPG